MGKQVASIPRTSSLITKMVDQYYEDVRQAQGRGGKVAYCGAQAPYEMLRTAGAHFIQSENYGSLLSARRKADEAIEKFESLGFAPEICTYCKASDAAILYDCVEYPYNIPKPDFLVCLVLCETLLKETELLARHLNVPYFNIDVPFASSDTEEELLENERYVIRQLRDFAVFLADMTGRAFDMAELARRMAMTKESARLRRQNVEMAKTIPSPLTNFDSWRNLFAANIMRGTEEAVAYFRQFNEEIAGRLARGEGALADEKYRLYWDLAPMLAKLRFISELFAGYGANFVASSWTGNPHFYNWEIVDPNHPLESLAHEYVRIYPQRNLEWRADLIVDYCRDYRIDGVVIHSPRTCKLNAKGQYVIAEMIRERAGVPVVILDGDMGDRKFISEEQIAVRAQAFIELVDLRKRDRGLL